MAFKVERPPASTVVGRHDDQTAVVDVETAEAVQECGNKTERTSRLADIRLGGEPLPVDEVAVGIEHDRPMGDTDVKQLVDGPAAPHPHLLNELLEKRRGVTGFVSTVRSFDLRAVERKQTIEPRTVFREGNLRDMWHMPSDRKLEQLAPGELAIVFTTHKRLPDRESRAVPVDRRVVGPEPRVKPGRRHD